MPWTTLAPRAKLFKYAPNREERIMKVTTIGIDIAKRCFKI